MGAHFPIIIASRSHKGAQAITTFCQQRIISICTNSMSLLSTIERHPDAILITDLLLQDDCVEGILQKAAALRSVYVVVCVSNPFPSLTILDAYRSGAHHICHISELSEHPEWLDPEQALINEMTSPPFLIMSPTVFTEEKPRGGTKRQVTFFGEQSNVSFANAAKCIPATASLSLVTRRPASDWCYGQFKMELESHFYWKVQNCMPDSKKGGIFFLDNFDNDEIFVGDAEQWIVSHGILSEREKQLLEVNKASIHLFQTSYEGYIYTLADGSDVVVPSSIFWNYMQSPEPFEINMMMRHD